MKNCKDKIFIIGLLISYILLLPSSGFTNDLVSFQPFDKIVFSPSQHQLFTIFFNLKRPAKVTIQLFTGDGNLVRELHSNTLLKPGINALQWDGKDSEGIIVPDEAYSVVLLATDGEKTILIDPREKTGGEIENELSPTLSDEGQISYILSKPSRVQIRAGIVDGPMLRSLLTWQPRPAGKNIQRWNGYDADKIIELVSLKNYGISVTAFNLPDYTLITTGNNMMNYRQYYKKKNWTFKNVPPKKRLIERNNKGVSPHYYLSRIADKNPKINIVLPNNVKKRKNGHSLYFVKNNKPIPVKVTMADEDERYMEETKYEVSFFIDLKFRSEEELGFMPITWLWSPNNLKKGKHVLTVNVSGFQGQVGVATVEIMIE